MLPPASLALPTSPDRLPASSVNSVLHAVGVLRQATVTSVHVEPVLDKASFNAQIVRLHVTYDRPEPGAPSSLIAKLPTLKEGLHENAMVVRPGTTETWFYRTATTRTPVNVPRCYYSSVDDVSGASVLLLQDLAPAQTGNQIEGMASTQAELALQSLARLHATWWRGEQTPEIQELSHLLSPADVAQNLVEQFYRDTWPRFVARNAGQIPAEVLQFGEHLVGRVAASEALLDATPKTLIHGDFRLENMLFGAHEGQPACWVIDWEDCYLWCGLFDVAWFLGGNLTLAEVGYEEALVQFYHRTLVESGVVDYSWGQCYQDYRRAMLSAFVQGILLATPSDTDNEHCHRRAQSVGARFMAACTRLRLGDIIPA